MVAEPLLPFLQAASPARAPGHSSCGSRLSHPAWPALLQPPPKRSCMAVCPSGHLPSFLALCSSSALLKPDSGPGPPLSSQGWTQPPAVEGGQLSHWSPVRLPGSPPCRHPSAQQVRTSQTWASARAKPEFPGTLRPRAQGWTPRRGQRGPATHPPLPRSCHGCLPLPGRTVTGATQRGSRPQWDSQGAFEDFRTKHTGRCKG